MAFLYFAVIVIAFITLAYGWRRGCMSAMGVPYATAERAKQPLRFWFSAAFNVLVLFAGVMLLTEEFRL